MGIGLEALQAVARSAHVDTAGLVEKNGIAEAMVRHFVGGATEHYETTGTFPDIVHGLIARFKLDVELDSAPPQPPGPAAASTSAGGAPNWGSGLPKVALCCIARIVQADSEAVFRARPTQLFLGVSTGEQSNRTSPLEAVPPGESAYGLLQFALVCRGWRAAQKEVSKLRTRVSSVFDNGASLELFSWALEMGCPRKSKEPALPGNLSSEDLVLSEEVLLLLGGEDMRTLQNSLLERNLYMFAASAGNLLLLKFLTGHRVTTASGKMIKSKRAMPVAQWAPGTTAFAALGGHREIVKWIVAQGGRLSTHTFINAGFSASPEQGVSELMRWLRAQSCPGLQSRGLAVSLAMRNNWKALQWARQMGCPLNDYNIMVYAAANGNLEMMKWLRGNGCSIQSDSEDTKNYAFYRAALACRTKGHMDVVNYLHSCGCYDLDHLCSTAASVPSLKLLRWARSKKAQFDETTMAAAAGSGAVDILAYLKANKCNSDEGAAAMAAKRGHLKALRWLRENGAPWDGEVYRLGKAHPRILEYAKKHGCPQRVTNWHSSANVTYTITGKQRCVVKSPTGQVVNVNFREKTLEILCDDNPAAAGAALEQLGYEVDYSNL